MPVIRTACRFACILVPTLLLLTGLSASADDSLDALATTDSPNFLVVLCDDLGYGDLACYGHEVIQTPNIDRLASQGLRLTSCYSACAVCSPSRAALMTGRTPYRLGIHGHIPWDSPMHLERSELTIATLLRRAGYATGHFGKWHLNGKFNSVEHPQPPEHGFDYWFSTQNNAHPNHRNPDNFVRNGHPAGPLEGYASELVVDEAIHWLRHVRPEDKPFFMYVCFHEPHEPIWADPRFAALYDYPDEPGRAGYYGDVSQMDHHFGRLLAMLDELQLTDSTLVWFTSDNGNANTAQHPYGSAGPLRARKGNLYEGGIRVPGIIRWPGHVAAGQTSDEPVCGFDLLPTLCELLGIAPPVDRALDGASITALLLRGEPVARTRALYFQYNRAETEPKVALRDGDWKLLATLSEPWPRGNAITPELMESLKSERLERFELYNLREDIGETRDLADAEPERLERMAARLSAMHAEVVAESPTWPATESSTYDADHIIYPPYVPRRR